MSIRALVDYAQKQKLTEYHGYGPVPIRWLIHIKIDGSFVNCDETTSVAEPGNGPMPKSYQAPLPHKRSSGISPQNLVDNAAYVFGEHVGKKPDGKKSARRALEKAAFRDRLKLLARLSGSPYCSAAVKFLERFDAKEFPTANPPTALREDLFGFFIEPEGVALHDPDNEAIREAVLSLEVGRLRLEQNDRRTCSVCGRDRPIATVHPAVTGISGATQPSAGLISFNNASCESYGLKQAENAQVCVHCAEAYKLAVCHLLGKDGSKRNQAITIGKTTTVLYWGTEESNDKACKLMAFLDGGTIADVPNIYRSNYRGTLPACAPDSDRFVALVLEGNGKARISIAESIDQSLSAAWQHAQNYFDDLDIALGEPMRLTTLIGSIVPPGKKINGVVDLRDKSLTHLVRPLLRCALSDDQYPLTLLAAACSRLAIPAKRTNGDIEHACRVAIAKAVLQRSKTFGEITKMLDEERREPAYVAGRLLALLDYAQQTAAPEKRVSIVDRYYRAASRTPAAIFGQIVRSSQVHLSKIKGPLGIGLNNKVRDLMSGLDQFPLTLNLQEQGLFAIGFYHQQQSLWTTWKRNDPDDRAQRTANAVEE
jgi:CRISPR-associated protein Csd1